MASNKQVMNEQIKSSEVELTGLNGEKLGIVARADALAMAKEHKADLVCDSLMSSPPPCRLVSKGGAAREKELAKKEAKRRDSSGKVKEIRLTAAIEDHDYDTKLRQATKLLESGNGVLLVVKLQGKEGPKAKSLLERMLQELANTGKQRTRIQLSGKQAAVELLPV